MAGKKDKNVICVVSGLTDIQANSLVGEFGKAKNKIAPLSRGTLAVAPREGIGSLLQSGIKALKD